MKIQWLKLEVDIFDNMKIKKIRRLSGGNEYFVLWIGLLTLGMKCKRYGILEISDGIPYTHDDLAQEFDMTPDTVGQALDVFEKFNMITRSDGDTIQIVNFTKKQNIERIEQVREFARIRQAKRRKKLIENNGKNLLEYKDKEEEEEGARESRVTVNTQSLSDDPETITYYTIERVRELIKDQLRPDNATIAAAFTIGAWQAKMNTEATGKDVDIVRIFFKRSDILPKYATIIETMKKKEYSLRFTIEQLSREKIAHEAQA
jgi:predicted phage replisome organizer